jgi:hypothetical protein
LTQATSRCATDDPICVDTDTYPVLWQVADGFVIAAVQAADRRARGGLPVSGPLVEVDGAWTGRLVATLPFPMRLSRWDLVGDPALDLETLPTGTYEAYTHTVYDGSEATWLSGVPAWRYIEDGYSGWAAGGFLVVGTQDGSGARLVPLPR